MKSLIATVALAAAAVSSAHASHFVLVHGAFGSGHVWDATKAALEAQGHQVTAESLPAHGGDTGIAPDRVRLNTYVRAVRAQVAKAPGKVILVGHSLSGMVISQVAELEPEKIERLVYVSAFYPQSGESAMQLLGQDKQSILGHFLDVSADHATATIRPAGRVAPICHDCPPEVMDALAGNGAVEPMRPFGDPVTLTEARFGRVRKAFIFTSQDRALGYDAQRRMAGRAGPSARYATLPSAHLPFIAHTAKFTEELVAVTR